MELSFIKSIFAAYIFIYFDFSDIEKSYRGKNRSIIVILVIFFFFLFLLFTVNKLEILPNCQWLNIKVSDSLIHSANLNLT